MKKVALALGVVFVLVLAAETAARWTMPSLAPVFVREGLYDNPLPLVTSEGGTPALLERLPSGERRLREDKAPGELRVAVLGESSVAGSPLDVHCSMPAMLLDELQRALPSRAVTVINMGRPGSLATNIYYYLVYLRRFEPDFVVFYMGMNDSPYIRGEQCMLGEHPTLLAAWQGVMETSWAAWLARTWGVQFVWRATKKSDWYPAKDCSVPTFGLWTELLVRQARSLGARVVIASPVYNPAMELERPNWHRPLDLDAWTAEARDVLACALTEGCDLDHRLSRALEAPRLHVLPSRAFAYRLELASKDLDWHRAALASGAARVPFGEILSSASEFGLPSADLFADWLRLQPRGYLFLARLVAAQVLWMLSGEAPSARIAIPTDADVAPYLDATGLTGIRNVYAQFQFGLALTVARGLRSSLASFDGRRCRLQDTCAEIAEGKRALAWLKLKAGLEPGVSAEERATLDHFDVHRLESE